MWSLRNGSLEPQLRNLRRQARSGLEEKFVWKEACCNSVTNSTRTKNKYKYKNKDNDNSTNKDTKKTIQKFVWREANLVVAILQLYKYKYVVIWILSSGYPYPYPYIYIKIWIIVVTIPNSTNVRLPQTLS